MKKIRTGVIGVGALGRHHLRWLSQIESSDLVGLYDVDTTRAKEYAAEYTCTAFDSIAALAKEVDAVSIVVPTTAHFEVASEVIGAGVHCLIEKPVTLNLEEASKLEKLATEKGVKVAVGHIERFNPAVRALDDENIAPTFIEAHRLAAFDPRGTDVAVILDLMIHDIDLTLAFIKSPIKDIQASAVAVVSEHPDIANARLTFENGAVANLTASRISLKPMRKIRLFQKSGYYSLDLATKQADLYRLASPDQQMSGLRVPLGKSGRDVVYAQITDDGKDSLGTELESFLTAVTDGVPVAVGIEQAARALQIALEVERIGTQTVHDAVENLP